MTEYIERETLMRKIHDAPEADGNKRAAQLLECILQAPSADVAPVVHGRWCWEGRFKACSICGSYVEWDENLGANFWKFCPNCGALMDGCAQK